VTEKGSRLDPRAILAALGDAGLTRVLVEGGGQFAAALLRAGVVDEIALFTAGLALGGDGWPALAPLGLDALAGAPRFRLMRVDRIGDDTLSHWTRD
jgi:diaminohydroxyphosphoribosylaminopyrimidine deaminase/5-amino-6-(5-phosphoribosylamino)uracil reductase